MQLDPRGREMDACAGTGRRWDVFAGAIVNVHIMFPVAKVRVSEGYEGKRLEGNSRTRIDFLT